ncbi:hypothetical protein CANINC_004753 [Pichia inconspicua]|uniref:Increased recombination centers protein 22 n=1 Tax=Pichia inconspicua TaxID=52247 RepID=A0A4T0WVC8_9ASCO|nr:hypothetical protein CANINC_004753 [[Candida] inconspicua]
MRLPSIAFIAALAFTTTTTTTAADVDVDTTEERVIVTDPDFIPTAEKPFNFKIDYNIAFKEDPITGEISDVYNGETIELQYTFTSLEPEDVSIVGVGGELLDPITGDNLGNVTASQIGPITVTNNQTVNFGQKIGINLDPTKYVLVPAIYIVYQDQFMMLGSKNKLLNVEDPVISFFHPQLLLAELVLASTFAALAYWLYNTYANTYLSNILPQSLLPQEKTKKKLTKPVKSSNKSSSSPSSTAKSADFEAWLPETHKKLSKRTN